MKLSLEKSSCLVNKAKLRRCSKCEIIFEDLAIVVIVRPSIEHIPNTHTGGSQNFIKIYPIFRSPFSKVLLESVQVPTSDKMISFLVIKN